MDTRHSTPSAPGPDLLARYLNAYLNARQLSDAERPWGLGDNGLDSLWGRLSEALAGDPQKLNDLISQELSATERSRLVETLAPLIFALPLRSYPAELRAMKSGPRLILSLRHLGPAAAPLKQVDHIGHLPAALTTSFSVYLRRVLRFGEEQQRSVVAVSSCGRRRKVRVTILARERGVVVRFIERLHSPVEDGR